MFYEFSIEKHIPTDHLMRSIDTFVDFERVRRDLVSFHSSIGRPSIDPELMIRIMVIAGFGIRPERRLCDEVRLNLAYRWFCWLGLDGTVQDHLTFQEQAYRFRLRDLLHRVFESVSGRCIEERLVGGEGFTVNASLLKADALRPGCALDRGARRPGLLRLLDELCGRRRERGHPSLSRRPR